MRVTLKSRPMRICPRRFLSVTFARRERGIRNLKMVNRLSILSQNKYLFSFFNKILKRLGNTLSDETANVEKKYLLILDFEATCDDSRKIQQEIIEFPCLKVNLENFKEEARFHQYVKPILNPELTNFCIGLTGIMQEVIDEANEFPVVYSEFEEWRMINGLTEKNSTYITSGDWDLGHMMPKQCTQCNIPVPSHMREWIDLKKLFGNHNKVFYNSFKEVMDFYGLEFSGKPHSGIDDCLNMLTAIRKMGESDIKFSPTSALVEKIGGFKVKVLNEKKIQFPNQQRYVNK